MGVILLTGASGAVGAAVLAATPVDRIVALSHRGAVAGQTVTGDITATWLGLDRRSYAALADEVDTVVHCAGTTDFTAPDGEMWALNVDGTRHVVAFAADANARLVFASTPFAADTPIDALPCDVVARALLALAAGGSGEHWLTAGGAALTIGRMVELVVERGATLGLTVGRPRFVRPATVDRAVRPVYIDPLPPERRREFDGVVTLASLFDQAPPFPSTLGELVAAPSAADLASAFAMTVGHLASVRGLNAAKLP